MNKEDKLRAIIWKLSKIPRQERAVLNIDIAQALARTTDEMVDFFYYKLVREAE